MPFKFIKGLFDGERKQGRLPPEEGVFNVEEKHKPEEDQPKEAEGEISPIKEFPAEVAEKEQKKDEEQIRAARKMLKKGPPPALGTAKKSKTLLEIEQIMEESLDGVYEKMSPHTQKEFKERGEEAAWKIELMLTKVKVKAQEIFDLIIKWLKLIPGVNKFFLEQEAKIKTDKILALKNKRNFRA